MTTPPEASRGVRRTALFAALGALVLLGAHEAIQSELGLRGPLTPHGLHNWFAPRELTAWVILALFGGGLGWLLGRALEGARLDAFARLARGIVERPGRAAFALALLAAAGTLVLRASVTQGADFTDDERIYAFQADVLRLHGFVAPLPAAPEAFKHIFTQHAVDGSGHSGIFPIGQPLLFALARLVGPHWLFQPFLVFGLVLLTFRLARQLLESDRSALLAATITASSPWLLFTAATQHNSIASSFFVALALSEATAFRASPRLRCAILTGVGLGAAVLVRPLDGLCAGLAVAGLWSWDLWRGGERQRRLLLGVVALAVAAALFSLQLAANAALTGSPLTTPYALWIAREWPGTTLFGFGRRIWGGEHHVTTAVTKTLMAWIRVGVWLSGVPIVAALAFVGVARRSIRARVPMLLGFALALALGYASYVFASVEDFGSVYHLPILPCLAILAAAAALELARSLGPRRVAFLGVGAWIAGLITFWIPASTRTAIVAESIVEPLRLAESAEPDRKLLILWTRAQRRFEDSYTRFPPFPSADPSDRVIWARDLPMHYAALAAAFPDRVMMRLEWTPGPMLRRLDLRPRIPGGRP